jgi:protein-tyrosine phosphatase
MGWAAGGLQVERLFGSSLDQMADHPTRVANRNRRDSMDRRKVLMSGLVLGALAAAPAMGKSVLATPSASVERLGPARLRLRWSGLTGPVKVMASSDADAPPALMRVLSEAARRSELDAPFAANPRPYFLIEARDSRVIRVAERLLPLEGGRNFRDLGGYPADNGKAVRWGRIYRSGVMSGLTANDLTFLAGLGIETVCDLRSADERTREPAPFKGDGGPVVSTFNYSMDATMASMGAMFAAKTREDAVKAFAASYVQMADFLSPHYTDMFARLMRRETPLAMNCSAGKDRTGLAAALVLSVLGVPRDVVIADYALSETFVPPDKYIAETRGQSSGASVMTADQAAMFARMPDPVLRVLMGTDADVMRLTLAEIDAQFGGPVALSKARYGLDDTAIAYLRSVYLV